MHFRFGERGLFLPRVMMFDEQPLLFNPVPEQRDLLNDGVHTEVPEMGNSDPPPEQPTSCINTFFTDKPGTTYALSWDEPPVLRQNPMLLFMLPAPSYTLQDGVMRPDGHYYAYLEALT